MVGRLSWVTAEKGLRKTALVLFKGCSTSWSHSLEKIGATKIDELQKSLDAEDRGMGDEQDFIATLDGQRDGGQSPRSRECARFLSPTWKMKMIRRMERKMREKMESKE